MLICHASADIFVKRNHTLTENDSYVNFTLYNEVCVKVSRDAIPW